MPVWKKKFLGPSSGESSQDCLLWNGRRSFTRQGVLRTDGSYTHPAPSLSLLLSLSLQPFPGDGYRHLPDSGREPRLGSMWFP
jgi:hypothetical protein